jgi:hypothetical protein
VEIAEPFWVDRYGIIRLPSLADLDLDDQPLLGGALGDAMDEL